MSCGLESHLLDLQAVEVSHVVISKHFVDASHDFIEDVRLNTRLLVLFEVTGRQLCMNSVITVDRGWRLRHLGIGLLDAVQIISRHEAEYLLLLAQMFVPLIA